LNEEEPAIFSRWLPSKKAILLLCLIVAVGTALRIYDLGAESIWLDESISVHFSSGSLASIVAESWPDRNAPPLYWIILHYWIALFGTSEAAVRSLSAIFGILAIPVTYLVGKELFSQKVGLIGSFISGISYFHIWYSQDARNYSLLLLLSLASYLFFIKILKQDKTRYYVYYFLANLFLGYTHAYGTLIIASQIFYFGLFWKTHRAQRIRLVTTLIATLISLVPLAVFLGPTATSIAEGGFWIPQPSLSSLTDTFVTYAGSSMGKYTLLLLFLGLSLLNLFSITRSAKRTGAKRRRRKGKDTIFKIGPESADELLLLVLWLSFPIVIPFVLSHVMTPFYLSRYTIGASPALYLLVAKGMSTLGRKSLYSVLIIITILSSFGIRNYYVVDFKEQWREVADLVETNSEKGDVIVLSASYVRRPFDYYYTGDLPEFGVDKNADAQEVEASVDNIVYGRGRMWLIISNVSVRPLVLDYMETNYDFVSQWRYRGIHVFLFDLSMVASE
jgi:uncharacterized membrane protein